MRVRGFFSQLRETCPLPRTLFLTVTISDCWWSSGFVANRTESVAAAREAAFTGCIFTPNRVYLSTGQAMAASSQHAASPEWAHMVTKMQRVLLAQRKQSQLEMCSVSRKERLFLNKLSGLEPNSMTLTFFIRTNAYTGVLHEHSGENESAYRASAV